VGRHDRRGERIHVDDTFVGSATCLHPSCHFLPRSRMPARALFDAHDQGGVSTVYDHQADIDVDDALRSSAEHLQRRDLSATGSVWAGAGAAVSAADIFDHRLRTADGHAWRRDGVSATIHDSMRTTTVYDIDVPATDRPVRRTDTSSLRGDLSAPDDDSVRADAHLPATVLVVIVGIRVLDNADDRTVRPAARNPDL
jgi:hypothetical protein